MYIKIYRSIKIDIESRNSYYIERDNEYFWYYREIKRKKIYLESQKNMSNFK